MRVSKRYLTGLLVVATAMIVAHAAAGAGPDSQPMQPDESRWFRNVRQLTSVDMGLDRSGEAYFSPDGKRISFQAWPKGKQDYQIYVMNLDGTGLKMVSTGAGATTCSYFYPSGEKLIFASNHLDQRPPEKPNEVQSMRPHTVGDDGAKAAPRPGRVPRRSPTTQPRRPPRRSSKTSRSGSSTATNVA